MDEIRKAVLCFFGSALVCAILFCCSGLFTGCKSTRAGVTEDILEYQQQVDRLEEELRNRDRTIDNAIRELAAITERSAAMEGTVDDVIELFNEYQRAVERLLRYYSETAAATDNKE